MTKEEKIKDVYEKLGFEWNVCEKYITDNGVLILPTPDLKYSLKGYENLVKDENKFSAFGKEGLKLQPSELAGIYNNNGWTKIESEDDLPEKGYYEVVVRKTGEITRATLDNEFRKSLSIYYSHYKKIQILDAPIY